jgi:hypothetical protein
MHLLDFLLLSSTLVALLLITAARMKGKLPDRRSGRSAQPKSMLKRFEDARIREPLKPVKLGSFAGILVHHDGPVHLVSPLVTAS